MSETTTTSEQREAATEEYGELRPTARHLRELDRQLRALWPQRALEPGDRKELSRALWRLTHDAARDIYDEGRRVGRAEIASQLAAVREQVDLAWSGAFSADLYLRDVLKHLPDEDRAALEATHRKRSWRNPLFMPMYHVWVALGRVNRPGSRRRVIGEDLEQALSALEEATGFRFTRKEVSEQQPDEPPAA